MTVNIFIVVTNKLEPAIFCKYKKLLVESISHLARVARLRLPASWVLGTQWNNQNFALNNHQLKLVGFD